MPTKEPSFIQACARCNSKKIKCHFPSQGGACEQCVALDAECTPRVRKKRKTTASTQLGEYHRSASIGGLPEDQYEVSPDYRSHGEATPGASAGAGTLDAFQSRPTTENLDRGSMAQPSHPPQDPGTGSSTYIGRSHYEGDTHVDESTARAYTHSRQMELSETEQKVLELCNVFALPPRAVHESLTEAFMEYCFPWMPIFEPGELVLKNGACSSFLLSQAVYLAASRVSSSPSVQAFSSPAEFYQRAKTLFWVGHEQTPLTAIKAITMLHWYTPDGPAFVSYDTSEYWLKIGVGLAYQIGLHRESLAGPGRAIKRRLWWTLVVRDVLISVSRGRPRAIQLQDSNVTPPTMEDFDGSPDTGGLFIAYVEVCCILGDLVQCCSRKCVTAGKRSELEAALFRWTRMLPAHLRLADYSAHTQTYELRPHNFRARQLHAPYLACIIVLSRSGAAHKSRSLTAVYAASYLAGIYEDLLARNLVGHLAPNFTTFGLMAGLALLSLRPFPNLWTAAQTDLDIILTCLRELSLRWKSAIGASNVIQKALDSARPTSTPHTLPLAALTREEAPLFEGFPTELCRMRSACESEKPSHAQPPNHDSTLPHANSFDAETQPIAHGPLMPLNLTSDLDFEPDTNLFDPSLFEGIPDYFWGDWGLGQAS